MQSEISESFSALSKEPEGAAGLAAGALVLAAEAKEDVDVEAALANVAALAERARPGVESAANPREAVESLNHSLFEVERFRGNREQYDDPRNSFLDEVLKRRLGLPITLSVLYVDIARRLGLEAYGIGFPGHFLAKVMVDRSSDSSSKGSSAGNPGHAEIIVDAFFGRILSAEDCAERLRAAGGADLELDPRWLAPASSREIYVRMLNNLKLQYLRRGDGLGALGCFDRILLLIPEAATEYRDRGLLLERMDCVLPAIEDLSRFLTLAPHDESAPTIRRRRDALSQRRPSLN